MSYPIPKQPDIDAAWPRSWRESFEYDRMEVWDKRDAPSRAEVGYVSMYQARRQAAIEAMLAACPPPASVLDLAAAQGNYTIALAGLGYSVTWNDLRDELSGYVKLKAGDLPIEYVSDNIFDLGPSYREAFDAILALEIIEHVAHPDAFLSQLATLVKPGGAIVLTTPNGAYLTNRLPRFSDCPDPSIFESVQFKPNSDGHIFLLYEDEVRKFAANSGLGVERLKFFTNPLTAGHMKLRHLLHVLPPGFVRFIENATRAMPSPLRSRLSFHMLAVLRKP